MEIVVRAAVVYFFLWLLLRAMGKRELAEVTAFELVVLVTLGDIVQQGVTQEDMSVTGAVLAISTFGLLAVASSFVARRFPASRRVLKGRPSVILRHGQLVEGTMRALRLADDDIAEAARKRGYRHLDELDWIIVEDDGKFSFIEARDDSGDADVDADDAEAGIET